MAFALPSGVLLGMVNAWQYFNGGLRFPFLKPVLDGPVRPFYGVYAYPSPLTHFELLIEWLEQHQRPKSALDLGTGCGVISLILSRISGVEEVVASDVSPNAVYGATEEFKRHNLDIEVVQSDLFEGLKDRRFDLVVFNPPWLPLPEDDGRRSVMDGGNFYPKDLFPRSLDSHSVNALHCRRHVVCVMAL